MKQHFVNKQILSAEQNCCVNMKMWFVIWLSIMFESWSCDLNPLTAWQTYSLCLWNFLASCVNFTQFSYTHCLDECVQIYVDSCLAWLSRRFSYNWFLATIALFFYMEWTCLDLFMLCWLHCVNSQIPYSWGVCFSVFTFDAQI